MNRISLYLELTKPRILLMVLVTTTFGFLLGGGTPGSVALLFLTLLGVGCATGGAAVLNNYLERDFDAKMVRTRGRAQPAGLIEPFRALMLGVSLVLVGVLLLVWAANLLAGFLGLLAALLYVLVYTPLKRINTTLARFQELSHRWRVGRRRPAAWVRAHGRCWQSCLRGSTRTSSRLPGYFATIRAAEF